LLLIVLRGIGVIFVMLMMINTLSDGHARVWKSLNALGGY
jgi:hypothetical protein